jgi:hypothetical protein
MYGGDSLKYAFIENQGSKVEDSCDPRQTFAYDHNIWESKYEKELDMMSTTKELPPRRRRLYTSIPVSSSDESKAPTYLPTNLPSNESNTKAPAYLPTNLPSNESNTKAPAYLPADLPSNESNTKAPAYLPADLPLPPSPPQSTSPVTTNANKSSSPSIANERRSALSSTLARIQFANIDIPPISITLSSQRNIKPIFGNFLPTDPFSLLKRPSETAVDCAEKAFRQKSKGKAARGVEIKSHGHFSRDGLTVLRKYCEIAEVKSKICDEENWLDRQNDGISFADTNSIKDLLWNNSLTTTVLQAGHKSIDVSSFSTLVKERYLDNFVIDTIITKYNQECKSGTTLYLPSEVHTWLKSDDKQFIIDKLALVLNSLTIIKLSQILLPLHMNDCHWGLIAIDLINQKIYFDDGYRLKTEPSLIQDVKKLLTLLKNLIPNIETLSDVKFYERFGMPYQGDLDSSGQGAGSCGVGVILSARDFIWSGIPATLGQFNWNFRTMRLYRKQLMTQIISWAKK